MSSDAEDAAVFRQLLDALVAFIDALAVVWRDAHLPLDANPPLDLTFSLDPTNYLDGVSHMLATVHFGVPVVPAHPKDVVTGRSLAISIDGTALPLVTPALTDTSYAITTVLNIGQVVVATMTDTNATGSRVVGTISKTTPDLTPGNLPLDATLDITFLP